MSIIVAYFSATGHTKALATTIAKGAEGRLVNVTKLDAIDWAELDQAGAIIMGAPTYMGGLPADFVRFIETAAERWDRGLWRDKLAGGFTTAMHPAGDKLNTLNSLFIFAAQMGMVWIGAAETGAPVVTENKGINRDGAWIGVTATMSVNDNELISAGDLETGRRYGIRMRAALTRWEGD